MLNYLPNLRSMVMQWHITERCNWHCRHCYQFDDYIKEELNTEQLFNVLEQYVFLVKSWNLPRGHAHINVTGGEPFLRKDFFELAERLGKYSDMFSWGLLSNGSFLTKEVIKKLKEFNISRYQVSLEGTEEYNDKIRGKGTFRKVINSIKLLTDAGIHTGVSLTLTKKNISQIPELAKLFDELGVNRLSTRRLIPYGRGSELSKDLLEPSELREYYLKSAEMNRRLRMRNRKLRIAIGCESGIFNEEINIKMHRRHCGVVDGRVMIVMPDGDVLPCRRLPIVIGNVIKQSLFEIYYSCNKLWELKNLNNAHVFCQKCSNFNECFGGAFCVKYCYTGKVFIPDVQCWRFNKKLQEPSFFEKLNVPLSKELKAVRHLNY